MDSRDDITKRFELLARFLDEREIRLIVAAEAESMGRGGVSVVAKSTGVSRRRISEGRRELSQGGLDSSRVRKSGAGRKKKIQKDATLEADLELLLEPCTRGDPGSPHCGGQVKACETWHESLRPWGILSAKVQYAECCEKWAKACRRTERPWRVRRTKIAMSSSGTSALQRRHS